MVNSTDNFHSTFNVFPLASLINKKSGPYNLALAYIVLKKKSWFIIVTEAPESTKAMVRLPLTLTVIVFFVMEVVKFTSGHLSRCPSLDRGLKIGSNPYCLLLELG